MTIPTTPADEALAREIERTCCISNYQFKIDEAKAAQLIAAHVAAQAPSGLAEAVNMVKVLRHRLETAKDLMDAKGVHTGLEQSGLNLADEFLAAHKAQPVAEVRGMVEAAEDLLKWANKAVFECPVNLSMELSGACEGMEAALASARHAMGGEVKNG